MSLTPCPECGKEVSSQAAACPGCGYPLADDPVLVYLFDNAQLLHAISLALLGLAIFFLLFCLASSRFFSWSMLFLLTGVLGAFVSNKRLEFIANARHRRP